MTTAILRALCLYALAEHQSGNAASLWVEAQDRAFCVRDDGRGHALDRVVGGRPYLQLVYTHLDYPFGEPAALPLQLHTLGISLINALCSTLTVTVHKPGVVYRAHFINGRLRHEATTPAAGDETGTMVEGRLNPLMAPDGIDLLELERWLGEVKAAHRSLRLYLNTQEILTAIHPPDPRA